MRAHRAWVEGPLAGSVDMGLWLRTVEFQVCGDVKLAFPSVTPERRGEAAPQSQSSTRAWAPRPQGKARGVSSKGLSFMMFKQSKTTFLPPQVLGLLGLWLGRYSNGGSASLLCETASLLRSTYYLRSLSVSARQ